MSNAKQAWAGGLSAFAGVMLMTVGTLTFLNGLAALFKDEFFAVVDGYLYKFDITAWGWIHLLLGILLVTIGVFVLIGSGWARIAGIIVAALSLIANFMALPYYQWWAVIIIALDIAVIWALTVWNPPRDI